MNRVNPLPDMNICSKETFYNGSGIRVRIGLTDKLVDSKTSYMGTPCKKPAIGYIMNTNGKVLNYYCYSEAYGGFQTFTDVNVFKRYLLMYKIKI